jgi:hypothetical protein
MTLSTIRKLASAEYSFVAIDAGLADLVRLLESCAADEAGCLAARHDLRVCRRYLRKALQAIDGPLTEAVMLHEQLEEAPF